MIPVTKPRPGFRYRFRYQKGGPGNESNETAIKGGFVTGFVTLMGKVGNETPSEVSIPVSLPSKERADPKNALMEPVWRLMPARRRRMTIRPISKLDAVSGGDDRNFTLPPPPLAIPEFLAPAPNN